MTTYFAHIATVTLRLPFDTAFDVQLDALRRAGIPMGALGQVETSYLFEHESRGRTRYTVFRWFAGDVVSAPTLLRGPMGQ